MKSITILFFTILVITSCKSNDVQLIAIDTVLLTNPLLTSKWQPKYYFSYDNKINVWGKAQAIDSLSKTYIIEFTSDNKFLVNGKPGGGCCYAGDNYTVSENIITFIEPSYKGCLATQYCYNCAKWTIEKLDNETLILEECNKSKIQYVKTK